MDCLYVFHCGRTYFSPGEKMLGSEVRAIDYNNGEFKIKHFVMNFITAQVYIYASMRPVIFGVFMTIILPHGGGAI